MQTQQEFQSYMQQLYAQFQEHDAQQPDRLQRYRNIEPESAQFISQLLYIQQSSRVLEIGTSTGYSTLWLAQTLLKQNGKLTTVEVDQTRSEQAKKYAIECGLDSIIEFQVCDALNYLEQCSTVFDLILLDAERDAYSQYWTYLSKLLNNQHGVLIVDNVISHADQLQELIKLICKDGRYRTTTLAIGAGLLMVTAQNGLE